MPRRRQERRQGRPLCWEEGPQPGPREKEGGISLIVAKKGERLGGSSKRPTLRHAWREAVSGQPGGEKGGKVFLAAKSCWGDRKKGCTSQKKKRGAKKEKRREVVPVGWFPKKTDKKKKSFDEPSRLTIACMSRKKTLGRGKGQGSIKPFWDQERRKNWGG